MLKQILLSLRILALGYSSFISFGVFHSALLVSLYQAFNCCSQSECFSQNSRNIFFAMILTQLTLSKYSAKFPNWDFFFPINLVLNNTFVIKYIQPIPKFLKKIPEIWLKFFSCRILTITDIVTFQR